MRQPVAAAFCLFAVHTLTFAEQQSDAPQTGKTYQCVDDAADHTALTAKQPRHQIKLKNAHEAPVQAADDGQDQSQTINTSTSFFIRRL